MKPLGSRIKAYWEEPTTVSIIDRNLHQLEIDTVSRHLLPTDHLADIGCGNGEATVRYAARVRSCVGFERSRMFLARAAKLGKASGLKNLRFRQGDILGMGRLGTRFDTVVSQRMLINLASWEEQQAGLRILHRLLKPGGRAILVENTADAAHALNALRGKVGLQPIPQHWHNRFFDDREFKAFLKGRFQLLKHYDFGLYYLLTRVYVQMFASFVGFGASAVKDPIFDRSDAAARRLFEVFGDQVRIGGGAPLGPIQVFVLRKEDA